MKRGAIAIGLVILVLVATGAAGADQVNTVYLPVIRGPWPPLAPAAVTKVVDGDTIWVDLDGDGLGDDKVRYILIDTPETYGGVECYGPEAMARNRELVEDRVIGQQADRSDRDRYQRLLRYVWATEADVGAVLIREGLGRVAIYDDTRHLCQYLELQDLAIAEGEGMWGACPEYPTPTPYPGCGR